MRAAIFTGTREATWTEEWVTPIRDGVIQNGFIIHGGARGVDAIAGQVAFELGVSCLPVKAMWRDGNVYNKAAGIVRNNDMLDILLNIARHGWTVEIRAYHHDLHEHSGTLHMMRAGLSAGVPVLLNNEPWAGLPGEPVQEGLF